MLDRCLKSVGAPSVWWLGDGGDDGDGVGGGDGGGGGTAW